MFATGETVSLAEWIIDYTPVLLSIVIEIWAVSPIWKKNFLKTLWIPTNIWPKCLFYSLRFVEKWELY